MEIKDGRMAIQAENRLVWREWLKNNCLTEKAVWLIIFHKKSKVPSVRMDEAVEEALCYGWIDSKAKSRDAESYYVTFTPRNPRSGWSDINKLRIKKLIANGLMTDYGMKLVEKAMETGAWDAYANRNHTV